MVPRKELFAAFLILLLASFSLFFLRRTTHSQQQHLRILAGSAVDQHWKRIQDLKDGINGWYSKLNTLKGQVGSGKVPWSKYGDVQALYNILSVLDGKLSTQRGLRGSDGRLWLSQKLSLWGAENGIGLQLLNARTDINCWSTFHPRGPAPAPSRPAPAPAAPSKVTQTQTQGDDAAQAQIVKELDKLNASTTLTAASPNAGDLDGAQISLNGNPSK